LGITGECAQGNHQFDYGGCWAGIINGEYLFVNTGTFMADPSRRGAVRVFTATLDMIDPGPTQVYYTQAGAGRLHPTQVVWPIMTLVTLDNDPPVYFVFDLATRQWLNTTATAVAMPPGATPTWSRQALDATALAIYAALPTLTPDLRLDPWLDADERFRQPWPMAVQTALALYPPPKPLPTSAEYTRATAQGLIYDSEFTGPPCGFIRDYNHWYGTALGQSTHVCAGADKDKDIPRQGAIVVEIWYPGDPKPTYIGKYWTPSEQEAVRILDVVGDLVILSSVNKTIFTFDLATRQWVNTPTPGPSPSISPLPSQHP
jgi:hypothetical protein